jgi:hypothetical protein
LQEASPLFVPGALADQLSLLQSGLTEFRFNFHVIPFDPIGARSSAGKGP